MSDQVEQVPGLYRRRVGNLVVTAVNDGFLDLPLEAMQGIEPRQASALLTGHFRRAPPRSSVNAFLVQGGGRTVLIDTGGGDMAPTLGRVLPNLAAAGVDPGTVDLILLTHLHPDHAGALAKDGEAVFANAELALSEAEAGFWLDEAEMAAAPEGRRPYFEGAQAAVKPYRERMRMVGTSAVAPGITPVPLRGHTPGHTGYCIDDGGDSLLIWGDIMHVPDVQSTRPEVGMVFDTDPEQAVETRRRLLDMVATDRLAVAGMHLHFPGFSHLARAGGAYALVPETWQGEV